MKLFKPRGFTLIEAVLALLLLGMFMIGISLVMSSLADTMASTEETANPNISASLVLKDLQQDAACATQAYCKDDNLYLINSEGQTIYYTISAGKLYRQAQYLAEVITGDFSATGDAFTVHLVLHSHKALNVTYYLKGAT